MRARTLGLSLAVVGALAACGGSPGTGSAPAETAPPAASTSRAPVASAAATVRLAPVGGRFDEPTYLTAPPGDTHRVFIVEKTGAIRVIRDGRRLPAPFLNLAGQVSTGSEQGLLSMAFAPDYAASGHFYVDYTDRGGDTRVVEFRRSSPDRASPATRRQVLFQHQSEDNHNGGLVTFGPDRLLYIGFGDGGGANDRHGARGNGQSLSTLLGKVVRIDPRPGFGRPYRIPASNPFARRPGARREIYAYGLRNPWRFSFDRLTGALVIADVGQGAEEEIDFALRGRALGRNYGWRVYEGRRRNYSDESALAPTPPVLSYSHDDGGCSITGGYVVRDRSLRGLYGRYVYGDFCQGRLRAVLLGPGSARFDGPIGPTVPQLSSFGEDGSGHVYATSLNGSVYRLVAG